MNSIMPIFDNNLSFFSNIELKDKSIIDDIVMKLIYDFSYCFDSNEADIKIRVYNIIKKLLKNMDMCILSGNFIAASVLFYNPDFLKRKEREKIKLIIRHSKCDMDRRDLKLWFQSLDSSKLSADLKVLLDLMDSDDNVEIIFRNLFALYLYEFIMKNSMQKDLSWQKFVDELDCSGNMVSILSGQGVDGILKNFEEVQFREILDKMS